MANNKLIRVFEHQSIKLDQVIEGITFDKNTLDALQRYYGENGVPYCSLINNGVKFNEFVGIIQITGKLNGLPALSINSFFH